MATQGNKKKLYTLYIKIIDNTWEKRFSRNIYAAAYFLNPVFRYGNEPFINTLEIMHGLLNVIEKQAYVKSLVIATK